MSHAALPTAGSLVSRRRAFPLAAVCLGLLAGFLPAGVAAAEPENAPAPPAAATGTADLPALNARLQTLLGQLLPYNIPHLDEIAAAPAPATVAELDGRLDQVYVATAAETARRIASYDSNLRALTDERVRYEAARVEEPKLERDLAAAPAQLKAEETRATELTTRAATAERIATALRDNAAAMEEIFTTARGSAINSVYYLLPAAQRVAFYNGTQKNANHPAYANLPTVDSDRAAKAGAAPAKSPAPQAAAATAAPPAPFGGTIDEKFAAFEDKLRALRNLAALLPPQEKQLAAARELADAQAGKNDALTAKLAEFAAPLARYATTAAEANDRILNAEVNQKISAGNLLRLGTSALLWTYLREHIVAPQMESFLQENRLARNLKGPALLDAITQQPNNFIPRSGNFDKPESLGALRRKLLDIEPGMDVWAGVATEAFVAGKISAGPGLTARFFKDLDKEGVAVLRASLDMLDAPQKKLATALLARAPAD